MFSINEMKELMAMGFTTDQIVAMSNDSSSKASKPNRSTSKVEREEKKKEEREEFKRTHKLVYTKEQNRQRVYEAMGYKKIQIEARVMGDLSMNHIIPVATHYQSRLAKNVEGMIHIFGGEEGKKLTARNVKIIREIAERTEAIERGVEALVDARKVANKIESEREKAVAYHDTVAPKMEEIRYQIDKLELLVADELWTLPKYRELLFIR